VTEHLCVVCPRLRDGEARIWERHCVCEGCRSRVRTLLAELAENYLLLEDTYSTLLNAGEWEDELDRVHVDPVALHTPAGPVFRSNAERVSGSRTPPLPLAVDPLDLRVATNLVTHGRLIPAFRTTGAPPGRPKQDPCQSVDTTPDGVQHMCTEMHGHVRDHYDDVHRWPYRQPQWSRLPVLDPTGRQLLVPDGDQVGYVGVAAWLDSWCQAWQSHRWALLPEPPTVAGLVRWLTDRWDWAAEHHPAVDDFAGEVLELHRLVRNAAGLAPPLPERKVAVPCRSCERPALFQWPGSDRIECRACPALLSVEEYQRWLSIVGAPEWLDWVRGRQEAS
jgi:hypothetical protein